MDIAYTVMDPRSLLLVRHVQKRMNEHTGLFESLMDTHDRAKMMSSTVVTFFLFLIILYEYVCMNG